MRPIILAVFCARLAGCATAAVHDRNGAPASSGGMSGAARMIVESLIVEKDYEPFVRAITDEAEKSGVTGFIWQSGTSELKLVVEGTRRQAEQFLRRVEEIGREMHALQSYTKPKWANATGRYKRFIWALDSEPPE